MPCETDDWDGHVSPPDFWEWLRKQRPKPQKSVSEGLDSLSKHEGVPASDLLNPSVSTHRDSPPKEPISPNQD